MALRSPVQRTSNSPNLEITEVLSERDETGSQFALDLHRYYEIPAEITLDQLLQRHGVNLRGSYDVNCDGIRGVAGEVVNNEFLADGTEVQYFLRDQTLVGAIYVPYSKSYEKGVDDDPHPEERAYDDPKAFFGSLKFK